MRYALISAMVATLLGLGLSQASAADNRMPGPDGKALWKYITETDPYPKWGQWADFGGIQKSRSPHGPLSGSSSTRSDWA